MNDNHPNDIEAAEAALHQALADKFGVPYLLGKLEGLIAEHRRQHGIFVPPPRHAALARRATNRDRPGRHLINEAM